MIIFEIPIIWIIGINRVISTSKIRNTTAIRKKWREKGIRGEFIGSNPHSNGLVFSRSILVFFEMIDARVIMADAIINVILVIDIIIIIIYTKFL